MQPIFVKLLLGSRLESLCFDGYENAPIPTNDDFGTPFLEAGMTNGPVVCFLSSAGHFMIGLLSALLLRLWSFLNSCFHYSQSVTRWEAKNHHQLWLRRQSQLRAMELETWHLGRGSSLVASFRKRLANWTLGTDLMLLSCQRLSLADSVGLCLASHKRPSAGVKPSIWEKTQVWFLALMSSGLQSSLAPGPEDWMPIFGIWGHPYITHTHTYT